MTPHTPYHVPHGSFAERRGVVVDPEVHGVVRVCEDLPNGFGTGRAHQCVGKGMHKEPTGDHQSLGRDLMDVDATCRGRRSALHGRKDEGEGRGEKKNRRKTKCGVRVCERV